MTYADHITRHTGIVKWFSRAKGYGFITPDVGEQEVFAHYDHIEGDGYRNLYENERVSYILVDVGKGPQAQQIKRLRSYGPAEPAGEVTS